MYLHGLATAVPPQVFTQAECWGILERSGHKEKLSRRSRFLLQAVLTGDSGVATRRFAFQPVERVFATGADELNEFFRQAAPELAGRALEAALAQAGCRAAELDALIICTCTGYLCPGVTSYVAERLGLRADVWLQDLVGLGCGAAIPSLRAAAAVLAAQPGATVACVAVEVCSAAFFVDDDPGVLISACLFGDGAAATVWRATPPAAGTGLVAASRASDVDDRAVAAVTETAAAAVAEQTKAKAATTGAGAMGASRPQANACAPRVALKVGGFRTLHRPEARDFIRFEQRDGRLRNLLAPVVPKLAAEAVAELWRTEPPGLAQPVRILSHGGGREVLHALEAALPGEYAPLAESRRVLREYGNMSSPSVLFALEDALRAGPPAVGEDWWLTAFGAGFAAHSCRVSRE